MTHQRWYLQGNQASTDITTRYKGGGARKCKDGGSSSSSSGYQANLLDTRDKGDRS